MISVLLSKKKNNFVKNQNLFDGFFSYTLMMLDVTKTF